MDRRRAMRKEQQGELQSQDASEPKSEQKSKSRGARRSSQEAQLQKKHREWEFALFDSRKLGQKLRLSSGSDQVAVKKLLTTFQDGRTASEPALRRTVLEALTPAAQLGHRGALGTQAKALTDRNESVRKVAVEALRRAALDQRPEGGGAVAVAVSEALPPPAATYDVDVRRQAAEALIPLAAKKDAHTAALAHKWMIDQDSADVRLAATKTMCYIGHGAEDAQAVADRILDKDWRVAQVAMQALEQIVSLPPSSGKFGRRTSEASIAASTVRSRKSSKSSMVSGSLGSPTTAGVEGTGGSPSSRGSHRLSSHQAPSKLAPLEHAPQPGLGVSEDSGTGQRSSTSSTSFYTDELGDFEANPRSIGISALTEVCAGEHSKLYGLPRIDAVAALGRMAKHSDVEALDAALDRFTDCDDHVRREAVSTFCQIAREDEKLGVEKAYQKLIHTDHRVRAAARQALCAVADKERDAKGATLAMVAEALEHDQWRSRRTVATTMSQLQSRGYGIDEIHQTLIPKFNHPDWSVRRKAIEAYTVVAESTGLGKRRYVQTLASFLNDPEEEVRVLIAECIPKVAPQKSKEGIALLTVMALSDPHVNVRTRAVESVTLLAIEGRSKSRSAIRTLAVCLEDEEMDVRAAAATGFCNVGYGRRCAIDACAHVLKHDTHEVRQAGVDAFAGVLGDGVMEKPRERAFKRLVPYLQHKDKQVRESAALALAACTAPKQEGANEGLAGPDGMEVITAAAVVVAKHRRIVDQAPIGLGAEKSFAQFADADDDDDDSRSRLSAGSRSSAFSKSSKASKSTVRSAKGAKNKSSEPKRSLEHRKSTVGKKSIVASFEDNGVTPLNSLDTTNKSLPLTLGRSMSRSMLRGEFQAAQRQLRENQEMLRKLEEQEAAAAILSESDTDEDDMDDEAEEKPEEHAAAGSKAGSRAGSKAGSRAGSKAGSRAASRGGSKVGS